MDRTARIIEIPAKTFRGSTCSSRVCALREECRPYGWRGRARSVEPSLCSTRESVDREDWRQSHSAPSRIIRTGPPAETMKRARQGGRDSTSANRPSPWPPVIRWPQNLQPKPASTRLREPMPSDCDRVRDQNYWEDVVWAAGLAAGPSDSGGMSAAAITSSGSRFHTCVLPSKGIPRYPRTERFLPSGLNSILAW